MIDNRELLLRPEKEQHRQYGRQTRILGRSTMGEKSKQTKTGYFSSFCFSTKTMIFIFLIVSLLSCLLTNKFMTLRYGKMLSLGKENNVYIIEELVLNQNINIINANKTKAKEGNRRMDEDNISKYDKTKKQKKKVQNKKKKTEQQQGIKQRQKLRSPSRNTQEKVLIEKNTATTTITSTASHDSNYSVEASATSISSSISKPAANPKEEEEGETFWTLKDEEDYAESLKPWANLTTRSFRGDFFFSGYRNQMMAFSAFIIDVQQQYPNGGAQILLNSLRHKDVFGTNKKIPHELIFDVRQWNSFYPRLPRLVSCDPTMHFDYDCKSNKIYDEYNRPKYWNSTSPKPWGKTQESLFVNYQKLQRKEGRLWNDLGQPRQNPDPTDLLMMMHALKLHPELNALVKKARQSITEKNNSNNKSTTSISRRAEKRDEQKSINESDKDNSSNGGDIDNYMVLHARIEPDMIDHPVCRDGKLSNLTTILQYMESKFASNPPSNVIVLTNMELLQPDNLAKLKNPDTKKLATENANALHSVFKNGLWNGTVKVTQIGTSPILDSPHYKIYKVTIGALINYDLSLNAKYFIGTEVSSFSLDILRSRFYSGHVNNNFRYHSLGMSQWTNENTTVDTLPTFGC